MPIDPLDPAVGEDPDSEDAYRRYVVRAYARKKGLDPDLAEALTQQESGFNPKAIGYDKHGKPQGRGMMQLLPSTAAERGLDIHDIHDTIRNADIGTSYLAEMRDKHPDDPNFYVRYFTGPGGNTQTPAALNYQQKVGGYLTQLQQGKKLGVPKKATPANVSKALATTRQPAEGTVDTTQPVSPAPDTPDTTTDTAPREDRGFWEGGQFVSEYPEEQMQALVPKTSPDQKMQVYQQVRGIEDRALQPREQQLPAPPYDEKKDPDSEFNYKLMLAKKAQAQRIAAMQQQEATGQGNAGQQGIRSGFYSPALPAPAEQPIRQKPRGAGYFAQATQPPIRSGFVSPGRQLNIAEQPPLTPEASARAEQAMQPAPPTPKPIDYWHQGELGKRLKASLMEWGPPAFPEAGEQIKAGIAQSGSAISKTFAKYTPQWLQSQFDKIDRATVGSTLEERNEERSKFLQEKIKEDPSFTGDLLRMGGNMVVDIPVQLALGKLGIKSAAGQMGSLAALHGGGVKDIAEAATVGLVLHGGGKFVDPRIAAATSNPIIRRALNSFASGTTGAGVGAAQDALNQLYHTGTVDLHQTARAAELFGTQSAVFGALHEPQPKPPINMGSTLPKRAPTVPNLTPQQQTQLNQLYYSHAVLTGQQANAATTGAATPMDAYQNAARQRSIDRVKQQIVQLQNQPGVTPAQVGQPSTRAQDTQSAGPAQRQGGPMPQPAPTEGTQQGQGAVDAQGNPIVRQGGQPQTGTVEAANEAKVGQAREVPKSPEEQVFEQYVNLATDQEDLVARQQRVDSVKQQLAADPNGMLARKGFALMQQEVGGTPQPQAQTPVQPQAQAAQPQTAEAANAAPLGQPGAAPAPISAPAPEGTFRQKAGAMKAAEQTLTAATPGTPEYETALEEYRKAREAMATPHKPEPAIPPIAEQKHQTQLSMIAKLSDEALESNRQKFQEHIDQVGDKADSKAVELYKAIVAEQENRKIAATPETPEVTTGAVDEIGRGVRGTPHDQLVATRQHLQNEAARALADNDLDRQKALRQQIDILDREIARRGEPLPTQGIRGIADRQLRGTRDALQRQLDEITPEEMNQPGPAGEAAVTRQGALQRQIGVLDREITRRTPQGPATAEELAGETAGRTDLETGGTTVAKDLEVQMGEKGETTQPDVAPVDEAVKTQQEPTEEELTPLNVTENAHAELSDLMRERGERGSPLYGAVGDITTYHKERKRIQNVIGKLKVNENSTSIPDYDKTVAAMKTNYPGKIVEYTRPATKDLDPMTRIVRVAETTAHISGKAQVDVEWMENGKLEQRRVSANHLKMLNNGEITREMVIQKTRQDALREYEAIRDQYGAVAHVFGPREEWQKAYEATPIPDHGTTTAEETVPQKLPTNVDYSTVSDEQLMDYVSRLTKTTVRGPIKIELAKRGLVVKWEGKKATFARTSVAKEPKKTDEVVQEPAVTETTTEPTVQPEPTVTETEKTPEEKLADVTKARADAVAAAAKLPNVEHGGRAIDDEAANVEGTAHGQFFNGAYKGSGEGVGDALYADRALQEALGVDPNQPNVMRKTHEALKAALDVESLTQTHPGEVGRWLQAHGLGEGTPTWEKFGQSYKFYQYPELVPKKAKVEPETVVQGEPPVTTETPTTTTEPTVTETVAETPTVTTEPTVTEPTAPPAIRTGNEAMDQFHRELRARQDEAAAGGRPLTTAEREMLVRAADNPDYIPADWEPSEHPPIEEEVPPPARPIPEGKRIDQKAQDAARYKELTSRLDPADKAVTSDQLAATFQPDELRSMYRAIDARKRPTIAKLQEAMNKQHAQGMRSTYEKAAETGVVGGTELPKRTVMGIDADTIKNMDLLVQAVRLRREIQRFIGVANRERPNIPVEDLADIKGLNPLMHRTALEIKAELEHRGFTHVADDLHTWQQPEGLKPDGGPPPSTPKETPTHLQGPLGKRTTKATEDVPNPTIDALPSDIKLGVEGKTRTTPGTRATVRYAIVDADRPMNSFNRKTMAPNPQFPKAMQQRNRARAASKLQMEEYASDLDYTQLGEEPHVTGGAPIVGPDLMLETGRLRAAAIGEAYDRGNEGSVAYKENLVKNAERYGMTADEVEGMERPMLVAVRTSPIEDRVQWAAEGDKSKTAEMAAAEKAQADVGYLDEGVMDKLTARSTADLNAASNREFVKAFIANLSPTEQGKFLTKKGELNQEGLIRVQNALLAKAFGGTPEGQNVIETLTESKDKEIKGITDALLANAPAFARIRDFAARGKLHALDIADDLAVAVNKFAELKRAGTPVEVYRDQGAMFGEQLTPIQMQILETLNAYRKSPKAVHDVLEAYAAGISELGHPNEGNLFAERAEPTPDKQLQAARNVIDAERAKAATKRAPNKNVRGINKAGASAEKGGTAGKGAELTETGVTPPDEVTTGVTSGAGVSQVRESGTEVEDVDRVAQAVDAIKQPKSIHTDLAKEYSPDELQAATQILSKERRTKKNEMHLAKAEAAMAEHHELPEGGAGLESLFHPDDLDKPITDEHFDTLLKESNLSAEDVDFLSEKPKPKIDIKPQEEPPAGWGSLEPENSRSPNLEKRYTAAKMDQLLKETETGLRLSLSPNREPVLYATRNAASKIAGQKIPSGYSGFHLQVQHIDATLQHLTKNHPQLYDEVNRAFNSGSGSGVQIVLPEYYKEHPNISLFRMRGTIRHEDLHAALEGADTRGQETQDWYENHPLAPTISYEIQRYPAYRNPVTHPEEAATHIAGGNWRKLGLSQDEGVRYLGDFFEHLVDRHGPEILDRIGAVDPRIAAPVKEIISGLKNKAVEGRGAGAGRAGLQAGGPGGTEGVAGKAGEIPRLDRIAPHEEGTAAAPEKVRRDWRTLRAAINAGETMRSFETLLHGSVFFKQLAIMGAQPKHWAEMPGVVKDSIASWLPKHHDAIMETWMGTETAADARRSGLKLREEASQGRFISQIRDGLERHGVPVKDVNNLIDIIAGHHDVYKMPWKNQRVVIDELLDAAKHYGVKDLGEVNIKTYLKNMGTVDDEAFRGPEYTKGLLGAAFRGSKHSFFAAQDIARLVQFRAFRKAFMAEGKTFDSHPEEYKSIADVINSNTGAGEFRNEKVNQVANAVGFLAWSTRYIKSRLDFFNPNRYVNLGKLPVVGQNPIVGKPGPFSFLPESKLTPQARWENAKMNLVAYAGGWYATMWMAHLFGGDTVDAGVNPLDTTYRVPFGTFRFGRRDNEGPAWNVETPGGIVPYIRLGGRMADAFIRGSEGETLHNAKNAGVLLGDFARNKLAPAPSGTLNLATGKDWRGAPVDWTNPLDWGKELAKAYSPFPAMDTYEQIQEYKDTPPEMRATPALISAGIVAKSFGIQNYNPNSKKPKLADVHADNPLGMEQIRYDVKSPEPNPYFRGPKGAKEIEPSDTFQARKARVANWWETYGQELVQNPRYATLTADQRERALKGLRSQISGESGQKNPALWKFKSGTIIHSVFGSEARTRSSHRGREWNPEEGTIQSQSERTPR